MMTSSDIQTSCETELEAIVVETDFLRLVLQVEDTRWVSFLEEHKDQVAKVAMHAYAVGYAHQMSEEDEEDQIPPMVEATICFSSDTEIRALNLSFRGKDKPTNVLSFPMVFGDDQDMDLLMMSLEDGEENALLPPLGDIIIAFETCDREAKSLDRLFFHHVIHLIVHGVLHLLDYDHERGSEDEEIMESLEIFILKSFDVPNPYLLQEDE